MPDLLLPLLVAVLGTGGITTVLVKWLSKSVDDATVVKLRAEAQRMAQETAASEVGLLREIIAEVRASEAGKDQRITRLEDSDGQLRERLDKLEERERHMLTRAAVHEAWDQITYNAILAQNPNHPPPPPLRPDALEARQTGLPDRGD